MRLQKFNYNSTPITFLNEDDIMVNATEMAKLFNKKPAHFLSTQSTADFMNALSKRVNRTQLVNVIHGDNGGTWMHQKLALKFAAWLSPDFELWVYDRIEELLLTGKTEVRHKSSSEIIAEGYALALKEAEQYKQQLALAENTIQLQAPVIEYAKKVLDADGGIPTSVIASDLGKSAIWLNKTLQKMDVLWKVGGVWVLKAKYKDKGYTMTKTHPYTDSFGVQRSQVQTYWTEKGRQFIHELINK